MTQAGSELPLIAAVNHAADSLGLLRAELARILGLMCGDVSDGKQLAALLDRDAGCRDRAGRFVHCYQLLEAAMPGETARRHWFRRHHAGLGTSPFHALVDEGRLDAVLALLARGGGSGCLE